MRLAKYLLLLLVITCLGLLYTHQKFLLIKANYSMKKHENQLSHLLDRNTKLMYNVAALESPANLEAKLHSAGMDYEVPVRWEKVKRFKSEPAYELASLAERQNVVLEGMFNFLTVKAEAKTPED